MVCPRDESSLFFTFSGQMSTGRTRLQASAIDRISVRKFQAHFVHSRRLLPSSSSALLKAREKCGRRPRASSLLSLTMILSLVESPEDSLFCFLSWSSDAN